MNNVIYKLLLAAATLVLATTNAFAWSLSGSVGIKNNDVTAVTVATSSLEEDLHGLYAVVNIPGDTSDNHCYGELKCKATAEVPSPVPGVNYCGQGTGMSLTIVGAPNPADTKAWRKCRRYQPPVNMVVHNLSFLGCHEQCARWTFSYSADFAEAYRIQSRPLSGGSWSTYTVTSNTSTVLHLGQNDRVWRVRAENDHGVSPYNGTYHTGGRCGNTGPGGGGGGPID